MIKTRNYVLRVVSGIPLLICTTVPHNNCWMYELNSVGKLIWEKCSGCQNIDELIKKIEPEFQTSFTMQQKETIKNYCLDLEKKGLLINER